MRSISIRPIEAFTHLRQGRVIKHLWPPTFPMAGLKNPSEAAPQFVCFLPQVWA